MSLKRKLDYEEILPTENPSVLSMCVCVLYVWTWYEPSDAEYLDVIQILITDNKHQANQYNTFVSKQVQLVFVNMTLYYLHNT